MTHDSAAGRNFCRYIFFPVVYDGARRKIFRMSKWYPKNIPIAWKRKFEWVSNPTILFLKLLEDSFCGHYNEGYPPGIFHARKLE